MRLLTAIAAAVLLAASPAARAQVAPDRLYHGLNRPIPFTVETPREGAELQLALYAGRGSGIVARAAVEAGPVDLFQLFPVLWNRTSTQPLYLQLLVDGEPFGAPVFLEPLRPPRQSTIDPTTRDVVWAPNKRRPYSGLRTYVAKFLEFETSHGDFTIKLRPDEAPNTAKHILDLVEGGFYNDIVIHRIIPTNANGDPFVIQFGDPRGFGLGGPGFWVDLEPSELPHGFGVVSMARRSDDPNSNGSQMFICLSRAATRHLDGEYTSFGEIVDGAHAILAIESVELADGARGTPADPKPVIKSARAVPAPPINQWPDKIERPAPTGADQTR